MLFSKCKCQFQINTAYNILLKYVTDNYLCTPYDLIIKTVIFIANIRSYCLHQYDMKCTYIE